MTPIAQAAAIAVVAAGTGAATLGAMNTDIPNLAVPDIAWQPGSELDGRVFYTIDTIIETGEVLRDELRFADGGFLSVMCEEYCAFGYTPYQTWVENDVIHFTSAPKCPDAPHELVWYGTVTGDEIEIQASWTTRRWYWTHQINATGSGSTTPHPPEALDG